MHSPNLGAPITRDPQPGGTALPHFPLSHPHGLNQDWASWEKICQVPLAPCWWGGKASSGRPQARVAKAVVRRWRGELFPQFLRHHRATQAGWVEVACEAGLCHHMRPAGRPTKWPQGWVQVPRPPPAPPFAAGIAQVLRKLKLRQGSLFQPQHLSWLLGDLLGKATVSLVFVVYKLGS